MSHPRSDIRAAIRMALEAAKATAPALSDVTVFRSWAQAIGAEDRPAIGVYTPRETAENATGSSVDKVTTIAVQYRADGGDDLDDRLDAVSAVIEPIVLAALEGEQLFGLDSTDIEITGEGSKPSGILTLTFSATRYAPEGQPG